MNKIDLSLEGILDNRWKLEETGNGELKLSFNSLRGIPSIDETQKAIQKVMLTKNIQSLYISGANGDVKVEKGTITLKQRDKVLVNGEDKTNFNYPFGLEENLYYQEERGVI